MSSAPPPAILRSSKNKTSASPIKSTHEISYAPTLPSRWQKPNNEARRIGNTWFDIACCTNIRFWRYRARALFGSDKIKILILSTYLSVICGLQREQQETHLVSASVLIWRVSCRGEATSDIKIDGRGCAGFAFKVYLKQWLTFAVKNIPGVGSRFTASWYDGNSVVDAKRGDSAQYGRGDLAYLGRAP